MFLDRQRHQLVFARDALMRELANPDGCWWAGRGDTGLVGAGVGPRTIAQDLEAMLDRKLEIRLKRVVRALEKIEEGTYGLCDITANPIARSRLEQVPEELESSEGKMLLRARDAMPDEAESSGA